VITAQPLRCGNIIQCEAIGVMEQTEDGLMDNNVLARLMAEQPELKGEVHSTLTDFVQNVFRHIPGRMVVVGRFLGREAAEAEIAKCSVDTDLP
jgi:inorganic pyrophosphatase